MLLIDGRKNSAANTKMVGTMIQTMKISVFLDAYDISLTGDGSVFLVEIVEKAIRKAKTLYNAKIKTVVSDNARNMIRMGKDVSIMHSRCHAHIFNLLMKDIAATGDRPGVISNITTILKEFSKPLLEVQIVGAGGKKMMLPNETRWCGIRDSLLNFVGNTDHMKNLMLGDTYVSQNVKTLIVYDLLCSRVNEIVLDLDEVGKA